MKQTKGKRRLSFLLAGVLAMGLTACSEEVLEYTIDPVTVRMISPVNETFSTTGSSVATLEPNNRVSVLAGVSGEVEKVYVSLGDEISQGTLICTVDAESAYTQRDNAQDSVTRAYENLTAIEESLLVRAPISGYVQAIEEKLNHSVSASSQLAFLNNQKTMTVKIPFLESLVDTSWIGKTANLSFIDTGEKITGTVTEISGTPSYLYSNIAVNYVTISVTNPGGIQDGRRVAAEVGGVTCSADGEFESFASSPVMCGLNGFLDKIYVNVGDYVNAGEVMFRVTSSTTDNQILNAQNSIADAVDARNDAVDLIADYRITAPISGTVSDVYIKALDNVGGTSAVVEISTTKDIELTFYVTESVVSFLSLGQSLDIISLSGEATGEITEISSVANAQTGLFTVKGRVVGDALMTGTSATVSYTDFSQKDALVIPFASVQFIGNQAFVFVVEEGVAIKKEVQLSRYTADKVIVLDGLTTSDTIISSWSTQLRNGLAVKEETYVSD